MVTSLSSRATPLDKMFAVAISNVPDKARESLAQQKEAVLTALSIAGLSRDPVQEWAPSDERWPAPSSWRWQSKAEQEKDPNGRRC